MTSITNIPEPSNAHRDASDEASSHVVPLGMGGMSPERARYQVGDNDQPEHQVDGVSCLLLLLIAGALLRIVLGVLGPLQGGLATEPVDQLAPSRAMS